MHEATFKHFLKTELIIYMNFHACILEFSFTETLNFMYPIHVKDRENSDTCVWNFIFLNESRFSIRNEFSYTSIEF